MSGTISDEGPLIDVLVSIAPARKNALLRVGFPVPQAVPIRAVVDTGAYVSGVDPTILEMLGLDGEIDVVKVHTPSTGDAPHPCPVYVVNFSLFHVSGSLTFEALRVLATRFRAYEEAKALIGRDILARCTLQYFGLDQRFILAW